MKRIIKYGDEYCVCPQCDRHIRWQHEMKHSRGELVCAECKEKNKEDDARAYDRDVTSFGYN